MIASVLLAFLAASAAPEASPAVGSPAAPAAKARKVCRSEAVIGSIAPKRVCTIVPARSSAPGQSSGGQAGGQQPAPSAGAGSSN
jgi:hypothetical protein